VVGSIREILNIQTAEALQLAFLKYDEDLEGFLRPLDHVLDKNILSGDVPDILQHMTWVESWRNRVSKQLSIVTGFVEYAKSSRFALARGSGITDTVRDQYRKTLAGPFQALQVRLENLVDSIDSRVNMCKKKLGMEGSVEGVRNNTSRFAA
jgi:hypothetical protein